MPLSKKEIIDILATGDFNPLVGEFETESLECKGQPYSLDTDERKLELAKDASGFANATGGLILIGFATKKDPTHGRDQVDRPRPFPLSIFNPDQYRQVIAAWVWPPLDNVEVRVFPSSSDPTHGVAAIVVPQAAEESRPLLVAKTVLDSPRKIEVLFGYCERKQAQVTHYDLSRLHALLRDGRRLDLEIRVGFQSLHSMVAQISNQAPAAAQAAPEDIEARISAALRPVGRYDRPAFVLTSIPRRALNLRSLFEARDTPLVQLLENPPQIRSSGFDLDCGPNSRIVEGRVRRAIVEGYNVLELHRDGVAVFVAPGNGDRLCWGRSQRQQRAYLINQLALIEMVYLFCLLVQRVYGSQLEPGEPFDLEMRILRLRKGDQNFYLEAGALGGAAELRQAPAESKVVRGEVRYGIDTPDRAAMLLLAELYVWVGYEEDRIPYTTIVDGVRVVDPSQIVSARW